jgi:hypothetical protein
MIDEPARFSRRQALALVSGLGVAPAFAQTGRRATDLRRIKAPEAGQAVAADEHHLYAISNFTIAKYDKQTGERVALWRGERGKPFIHLDSGIVYDGVLWCTHSNYPDLPMTSSIETFDTKTLEHRSSYSFGIGGGSATWMDLHGGYRYVNFAHYRMEADEADRDPRWTTLIQYDNDWRQLQAWIYPAEVIARLDEMSISGGVFGRDGLLYTTPHHAPEIYVFSFPTAGSTLVLKEIIPTPFPGQGIALDPEDPTLLYGIDRPTREIVVTRIG